MAFDMVTVSLGAVSLFLHDYTVVNLHRIRPGGYLGCHASVDIARIAQFFIN